MPKVAEFRLFLIRDRASRGAHAAQARALRERLRCASDTLALGTLNLYKKYPIYGFELDKMYPLFCDIQPAKFNLDRRSMTILKNKIS